MVGWRALCFNFIWDIEKHLGVPKVIDPGSSWHTWQLIACHPTMMDMVTIQRHWDVIGKSLAWYHRLCDWRREECHSSVSKIWLDGWRISPVWTLTDRQPSKYASGPRMDLWHWYAGGDSNYDWEYSGITKSGSADVKHRWSAMETSNDQ